VSYKFTIEEQGTYTVFSGEFNNEDLINSNNEIYQIPHFSDIKYQILNFNNVNKFPVDATAIRAAAEQDARFYKINPNIKVAIIATEIVIKGLINMYRVYFEFAGDDTSWEIQNFSTDVDARNWVNS
jgi:hypothetical protein